LDGVQVSDAYDYIKQVYLEALPLYARGPVNASTDALLQVIADHEREIELLRNEVAKLGLAVTHIAGNLESLNKRAIQL
jgi:hypothetical protein